MIFGSPSGFKISVSHDERNNWMKQSYLATVQLVTLCLALILVSIVPETAIGFSSRAGDEADCSSCHKLTREEATDLLEGIVKKVENIGYAHIPGLFAASVTGNDGRTGLIYIDFSKTYIISGVTISIVDRQNISKKEMINLVKVDTSKIPFEGSLILGNPKAPKKVFLFTDPQCPFCKKIHPELKKAVQIDPQIVFFIKLMPLVSLHPDAYRIAKSIMCEESIKLLEDSLQDRTVPDPKCDTDIVDRTLRLAKELGIESTPTLIFPDGRMAPGYRPAKDIVELINSK
jgi:thiol:disulfide interchange protein DsbC